MRIRCCLLSVCLLFAAGCMTTGAMRTETDSIRMQLKKTREIQERAVQYGGKACGVQEMAIAEAQSEFAGHESEQGDALRAMDHLESARLNARSAYSLASECLPPDSDSDGIRDPIDRCPQEAEDSDGYEDQDGCPDRDNDNDGLPDVSDACPNIPEDLDRHADDDGCPDPDSDRDGVSEPVDGCPIEPEDYDGYADDDGCPDPDNDADGIHDTEDLCPNEPEVFNGLDDEDGCPDQVENKYTLIEVTETRIELKQTIHFATAKAIIMKDSFRMLDEVADALSTYRHIRVRIEGHTDDQGSDSYNLDLSDRRAKSVREYLVGKGIDPARMKADGYGEGRPIASNRTAKGRAMNRRVEFNIVKPGEEL